MGEYEVDDSVTVAKEVLAKVRDYCETKQVRLLELFKQFDKDNDGYLNSAELRMLTKKLAPEAGSRQFQAFQMLLDENGDGLVSYKEFNAEYMSFTRNTTRDRLFQIAQETREELPQGYTRLPDGNVRLPKVGFALPDGSLVDLPEGCTRMEDANYKFPEGTIRRGGGLYSIPDGSWFKLPVGCSELPACCFSLPDEAIPQDPLWPFAHAETYGRRRRQTTQNASKAAAAVTSPALTRTPSSTEKALRKPVRRTSSNANSKVAAVLPAFLSEIPAEVLLALPEDVVQLPDGALKLPSGIKTLPDGSVQFPNGTIALPDGSFQLPQCVYDDGNGNLSTLPAGTMRMPSGLYQLPSGTVRLRNGSFELSDGTIVELPINARIRKDGTFLLEGGILRAAAPAQKKKRRSAANGGVPIEDSPLPLPVELAPIAPIAPIADDVGSMQGDVPRRTSSTASISMALPEGVERMPDGSIALPEGTIQNADGSFLLPSGEIFRLPAKEKRRKKKKLQLGEAPVEEDADETVKLPKGSIVLTDDTFALPAETVRLGRRQYKLPDGTVWTLPMSCRALPDGNFLLLPPGEKDMLLEEHLKPDGKFMMPDGAAKVVDNIYTTPDGTLFSLPEGTQEVGEGGFQLPVGAELGYPTLEEAQAKAIAAAGRVEASPVKATGKTRIQLPHGTSFKLPEGFRMLPDGTFLLPKGAVKTADNVYTLPNGNVFRFPVGTEESEDGHYKLPMGAFSLPAGSRFKLPEGAIKLPNGTFWIPDGSIFYVPDGSTEMPDGTFMLSTDPSATEVLQQSGKIAGTKKMVPPAPVSYATPKLPPVQTKPKKKGGGCCFGKPAVASPAAPLYLPEGSVQLPNGDYCMPAGTSMGKDGTCILRDGTVFRLPADVAVSTDGTFKLKPGSDLKIVVPDYIPFPKASSTEKVFVLPAGAIDLPDNRFRLPPGGRKLPDGTYELPDGTLWELLEGYEELPDGTFKLRDRPSTEPERVFKPMPAASELPESKAAAAAGAGAPEAAAEPEVELTPSSTVDLPAAELAAPESYADAADTTTASEAHESTPWGTTIPALDDSLDAAAVGSSTEMHADMPQIAPMLSATPESVAAERASDPLDAPLDAAAVGSSPEMHTPTSEELDFSVVDEPAIVKTAVGEKLATAPATVIVEPALEHATKVAHANGE
eukprot:jgi/Chlat1/8194/Chrsp76S07631